MRILPLVVLAMLGAQTTYAYYPDSDWVKFDGARQRGDGVAAFVPQPEANAPGEFERVPLGRENEQTDHYGNTTSRAYDARGNVTVQTTGARLTDNPAAPTTGYTTWTIYNALGAPTQITDPAGRVQTFTYDPATNNLLTHTLSPNSNLPSTTSYSYNSDGTLDTITDALGTVTSHAYNYAFSDAAYPSAVKQITVTISELLSPNSYKVLRVTRTLYDAQENLLAQIATRTLPQGGTEDIVTTYLYDTENRLRFTTHPDGRVTELRYTSFGQLDCTLQWRSMVDALASNGPRVDKYFYDNRGNLNKTRYPDGSTEETSFDLENRRAWSQDRLGRRTHFQYDDVGRLTRTYVPDATPAVANDNPFRETIYDLIGRVRYEMDEVGNLVEYTYDNDCGCAMRRKSMIRHLPIGNEVTHFDYDQAGNQTLVTDPRGNTTLTDYDDQGRPTTVHYPATDEHPATTMITGYDLLGRRVSITDQEGKITRNRFDGLGRLVEVRQYLDQSLASSDLNFNLSPSTANLVSTRFAYDELGNQLTQVDARGNTTSYHYDSEGRRTKRTLPDAAVEMIQYDEWGNLWKRTDFKGYTTTFLYDTLNRLTEKQADPTHPSLIYSHAPNKITYGYDAAGNRTDALVEKGSTVLYAEDTPVDERGRRQFKDTALGKLTYDYYANSLLKSITSSNSDGVKLGYRYDEANRLSFVDDSSSLSALSSQPSTTSYTYNANGSLATVTTPNGIKHSYVYDTLNRLRGLSVSNLSSQILHSYTYNLRASGHRRQVLEGAKTTTYTYDDLYRLTNEAVTGDTHGNSGSVGYTLDKVGNREARTSSVSAVPAAFNSFNNRDWLSGDSYDANGNTTLSTVFNLQPDVYDFEDHLIIRRKLDGSTVNLSYDADGLLRQKTVFNSALTLVSATGYLQDAMNPTGYAQIMEERINAAAGTTVKTYAYGSDLISQAVLPPSTSTWTLNYFQYDGLGSVRELTNASGTITDTWDYDAFGVLVSSQTLDPGTQTLISQPLSSATLRNAYLYRGERFEADIGQYYLRARFYNQNTGRFWNQDSYEGSASDPMSLHKYLYANADPVMGFDPSGHMTIPGLSMAAAIVGRLASMAVPAVYVGHRIVNMLGSSNIAFQLRYLLNSAQSGLLRLQNLPTADWMMRLNAGQGWERILHPAIRLLGGNAPTNYIVNAAGKAKPDWFMWGNIIDAKLGQALSATAQQFQVYLTWAAQNQGSVVYFTLTRVPPTVVNEMVAAGAKSGVTVQIYSLLPF